MHYIISLPICSHVCHVPHNCTIPFKAFVPLFLFVYVYISLCICYGIHLFSTWSAEVTLCSLLSYWRPWHPPAAIHQWPHELWSPRCPTTRRARSTPVPASITAASVKIPPFWLADPLVWLAQVKAQFATRSITCQRTRFDHVVLALSNEFATEVRDIIFSQPEVEAYSKVPPDQEDGCFREEAPASPLHFKGTQRLEAYTAPTADAAAPGRLLAPNQTTFPPGTIFQRLPSLVSMVLASPLGTLFPSTPWPTWLTRFWKLPHPQCHPSPLHPCPRPLHHLPLPDRKWPSQLISLLELSNWSQLTWLSRLQAADWRRTPPSQRGQNSWWMTLSTS